MREVFVDTSGWVALKHKGDTFWQAATTLHRTLLTAGQRVKRVSLPTPAPNKVLQATPYSVRSCLAPAFGRA